MADEKMSSYQKKVIQRLNKRLYGSEDSAPDEKTKNIYPVVVKKSFFKRNFSVGYFVLSAQRLYFMVDHPYAEKENHDNYVFFSTAIKDLTTVYASYYSPINFLALFWGICFAVASISLISTETIKWWLMLILLGIGGALIWGAFTFLRKVSYKITIGSVNGGISIGNLRARMFSTTHIPYYGSPIVPNFFEFVEVINSRIATLQERGDYA